MAESFELESKVGAEGVSCHEDAQEFFKTLAEPLVQSQGRVDRYSLFLEIALDDLAFSSDFQQAADGSLHYFLIFIHPLEECLGALGKEEQLLCGWRKAFVLGLVEEVPLDQLLDVLFAEMVGVDLALQEELQQLAADLKLVDFVDRCAGESFSSSETGFLELQHKQVEQALSLQSQLPDQVQPVDVDGF